MQQVTHSSEKSNAKTTTKQFRSVIHPLNKRFWCVATTYNYSERRDSWNKRIFKGMDHPSAFPSMLRSSSGLNQSTSSLNNNSQQYKQQLYAQNSSSLSNSSRYGSSPSIEPRQTRTSIIRRNSTYNPNARSVPVIRRQSMHLGEKKAATPRYSRASTMSPTMENSQRDFVNGKSSVPGSSSNGSGMSTLERQVAKKKELSSILRKSGDRSIDTVDGRSVKATNGSVDTATDVPPGDVPKLSKENLSKHVRIFAVDNSDSDHHDSELGYTSDRRPSFGSLRGYNLHSRRISIDSLDTRRGDSRRGSIGSVQGGGDEVFRNDRR